MFACVIWNHQLFISLENETRQIGRSNSSSSNRTKCTEQVARTRKSTPWTSSSSSSGFSVNSVIESMLLFQFADWCRTDGNLCYGNIGILIIWLIPQLGYIWFQSEYLRWGILHSSQTEIVYVQWPGVRVVRSSMAILVAMCKTISVFQSDALSKLLSIHPIFSPLFFLVMTNLSCMMEPLSAD